MHILRNRFCAILNFPLCKGSNNVPFFTDYPYVTNKDRRAGPITSDEVFYVKYILKPQPLSSGKYVITLSPGNNFKVCKLIVTHIGRNFPCSQLPTSTPTGQENTVWGFAGTDFAENTDVVVSFAVSKYHIYFLRSYISQNKCRIHVHLGAKVFTPL